MSGDADPCARGGINFVPKNPVREDDHHLYDVLEPFDDGGCIDRRLLLLVIESSRASVVCMVPMIFS